MKTIKKLLTITTVITLLAALAACGGDSGNDAGSGDGPGDPAVYQRYQDALAAMDDAGSSAQEINVHLAIQDDETDIVAIDVDGEVFARSRKSDDLLFSYTLNQDITMLDYVMSLESTAFYRDGVFYLDENGIRNQDAMEIDAAAELLHHSLPTFSQADVISQSADGDTLHFTLDGSELNDMAKAQIGDLKNIVGDAIAIKSIELSLTLDGDGAPEAYVIDVAAEIDVNGSMHPMQYHVDNQVRQLGGVIIEFPGDLETYGQ